MTNNKNCPLNAKRTCKLGNPLCADGCRYNPHSGAVIIKGGQVLTRPRSAPAAELTDRVKVNLARKGKAHLLGIGATLPPRVQALVDARAQAAGWDGRIRQAGETVAGFCRRYRLDATNLSRWISGARVPRADAIRKVEKKIRALEARAGTTCRAGIKQ